MKKDLLIIGIILFLTVLFFITISSAKEHEKDHHSEVKGHHGDSDHHSNQHDHHSKDKKDAQEESGHHSNQHDHHSPQADYSSNSETMLLLPQLDKIPKSGKAREAGFDGRYGMEPTGMGVTFQTRCAQASRGLVMISNAEWNQCGCKPEGSAHGPGPNAKLMDHSMHDVKSMGHSKMEHGDRHIKLRHDNGKHHGERHWNAPDEFANIPNPIPRSAASVRRGCALFQKNCMICHGRSGKGDGPSAAVLNPKPANLTVMAGHHPDGDFAWKISNGRGAMPAWKRILSKNQIWDLVNFIQDLGN